MIKINRRNFLRVSGASLCAPSLALSNVNQDNTTEIEKEISENIRHNVSSFRALNWKPYFKALKRGAILVDISSRSRTWKPPVNTRSISELDIFPNSWHPWHKKNRAPIIKRMYWSLQPAYCRIIRNDRSWYTGSYYLKLRILFNRSIKT